MASAGLLVAACDGGTVSEDGGATDAPACAADLLDCGGTCVNTQTDNANCGDCGNVCPAGQVCSGGACGVTCQPDRDLCTDDAGALYCANFESDNANCGACGNVCPAGQVCSGGACGVTCQPDQMRCTDDGGADYCADVAYDPSNCGGCGVTCLDAEVCLSGACVDLMTDRDNCGAPGRRCELNQDCSGSTCVACTPTVTTMDAPPGPIPSGTRVDCREGPSSSTSAPCPVLQCGVLDYWAFSYNDNRFAFHIVGYDPDGNIVHEDEHAGARYLWDITLDSGLETATFWGSGGASVTIPWSHF